MISVFCIIGSNKQELGKKAKKIFVLLLFEDCSGLYFISFVYFLKSSLTSKSKAKCIMALAILIASGSDLPVEERRV